MNTKILEIVIKTTEIDKLEININYQVNLK
jgi:hypothetical protein